MGAREKKKQKAISNRMKLYDSSIRQMESLLATASVRKLDFADAVWEDMGEQAMILRSDMAYELGAGAFPAYSGLGITADTELVSEDEVLLYGPDLPEIKGDQPYARLTFVRVDEDSMGEGNDLYNAVRKIEYARYHLNPKGYMMRISASSQREPVRIGKKALEEGLDFAKVGRMFVDCYHENPKVQAVKVIFITDSDFDYDALAKEIRRTEDITKAIDHIFKNVIMDCQACSLQEICDEVEGMRELHFGQKKGE